MQLEPGSHLGSYVIATPLGTGGMGEVYRAKDTRLDRDVAIKVLPEDFSDDNERMARFEREAKALAAVNHPNIATVHGFEQDGETRFLVMELVEGEDLAERITRGDVPVDEVLELFIQIADGLDTAHEAGIVHRDLKPANILVNHRSQAKILDFGLAKVRVEHAGDGVDSTDLPTRTADEHLTETGATLGTLAYMSPEQARGEPVDARSDIFSLGAVLYETATGRQAFSGNTAALTHDAILNRAPAPPTTVRPELSAELEQVILRCVEKQPRLRYQSAADLRADDRTRRP